MSADSLSLYIHIPFCRKKCWYCDFLSFPGREADFDAYAGALSRDIALAAETRGNSRPVYSVFIGGGTPTLLSAGQLERILSAVRENFSLSPGAEITVEANPESVTPEKLEALLGYGVNRLSVGAQSLDDGLLKAIGRAHSAEKFFAAFETARRAGFRNINIDLMFGLPGQTPAQWRETLERAAGLLPEHISCYSLTLEEGGVLSDEADRGMYRFANEFLGNSGYERYEISNFAKPGFECRHNMVYWTLGDYLGLGLGAHSFMGGKRFHRTENLGDYLSGDFSEKDLICLSESDKRSEFMFLGLRVAKGVSGAEFARRFGLSMRSEFGKKIRKLAAGDLLTDDGENVCLTDLGMDLANRVFVEMI